MYKLEFSKVFDKQLRKIKDKATLTKIEKIIDKIKENPEIGKPLRYSLKGERTIYVKPYRLIYMFRGDMISILNYRHRDEAYNV